MRLFSDRGTRTKWEAGLAWFRLRYLEPPTRSINLLSRPAACGRVALYYRPGEPISQLYLGVPENHSRLLARMAADFGFSLAPKPPAVTLPAAQRMTAVTDLPWDKPFMAHIANEFAFVENKSGRYLPQPPGRGVWRLPASPPPGLSLSPSWNGQPAHPATDPRGWPLGWSAASSPVHVSGRVNLYGRQEAVAGWLLEQVTQMLALDHANLVVIDGAGDLVPRLKRKAAVTRLLGKGLAYVELDGAGGFNPLAAVPGETERETVQRWQRWFQGMNVHPQAVQLLAQARRDGVGDIPALQKWLKQTERQGQQALSTLKMALNRLTADRRLSEWPANRFETLPEGALFFACKNAGWARQQLLRAALLAGLQVAGVRLVVHGFPWGKVDLACQERIVLSNGPLLSDSARLLVASKPAAAARLAELFLNGDALLAENLEILAPGQAILVNKGDIMPISWVK